MIKYSNYALGAGLALFILGCSWSLWYTVATTDEANRSRQEYAASCNKQGGMAIAPDGMYQCVKWEVK